MLIIDIMSVFVKYIFPLGFGFILGIGVFSMFGFTPLYFLTILFIAFLLACFTSGFKKEKFSPPVIVLLCIGLWSGALHTGNSLQENKKELNIDLENEVVLIVSEEKVSGNFYRYIVEMGDGTNALLTTFPFPYYSFGTKVALNGKMQEPPILGNFDYKTYLKKEGISATIYLPEITVFEEAQFSVRGLILKFKRNLRRSLYSSLSFPHNTIAGAMILGDSDRVSKEIGDIFSSTGIRHIIAISGMHITIVASLLMVLFNVILRLSRDLSFYIVSLITVLFVFFVGAPPSAVRAGIMGIIFLFAYKKGKIYNAPRALFFVALFMLILNPLLLVHDIGFQLSFLAVSGILYLSPHIEHLFGRERSFLEKEEEETTSKTRLKDNAISLLSVSIGAHVSTLPVVAYNFGTISLTAPIANLIAVPLVPVVIISSFLTSLFGIFSSLLASLSAIPAFVSLEIILKVTHWLDRVPLGSFEVEIGWIWLPISYLILLLIAFSLNREDGLFNKTIYRSSQFLPPVNKPF